MTLQHYAMMYDPYHMDNGKRNPLMKDGITRGNKDEDRTARGSGSDTKIIDT
jgi:hypothetical protein